VHWDPSDEELRERFVQFLKSKKRPVRSDSHVRKMLSYLDRYMPPEGLSRPEEVFDMFMRCPETTRHHLDRAFRNLLNFYRRVLGYPRDFIEALKEAIPAARGDFEDKWVPGEELVIRSLRELRDKHVKSFVFLNAQLDCPTRPMHLAEMLESFDPARLERTDKGFYKYRLGIERATKNAWVVYLTPYTVRLLRELHERGQRITYSSVDNWLKKHAKRIKRPDGKEATVPLRPKYIRKFTMNMMRRASLDKDVVQFLAGEKPKGIDERHYLDLELLADEQYPRYMKFLEELRAKAGLTAS